MKLYPYQEIGSDWLASKKYAFLADEPGVGKTLQAIVGLHKAGVQTPLILCPASLRENWRREFYKAGSTLDPDIVSYEGAALGHVPEGRYDAIICDEAHYLKTASTKRTVAVYGPKCTGASGLVTRTDRMWLLSGTPAPNNQAELYPHIRALLPDRIIDPRTKQPMGYNAFERKFTTGWKDAFGWRITGSRNTEELRSITKDFFLRRLKKDVLKELPPVTYDHLYLTEFQLPSEFRNSEIAELVRQTLEEHGIPGLRKLTSHIATLRRLTGLVKVRRTAAWIRDFLDCTENKIVVFAHHIEVIDALDMVLRKDGIQTAIIVGSVPGAKRMQEVDRFQEDPKCRVFIGQISAAGTGLTLTAASDLLFLESDWVPGNNVQAAMRIHRVGQKNACIVRFATLAGSVDEQIQAAVMRKTVELAALFD